jgi:hypothetical protein
MTPEDLLELLIVAANAKTEEEQARVAWRASDYMWRECHTYDLVMCRQFNDLLQDKQWPHVGELWTKEEVLAVLEKCRAKPRA